MKYIIYWNAGYGQDYDVFEADTYEEAEKMAYEQWREQTESQASYGAREYSEKAMKEFE